MQLANSIYPEFRGNGAKWLASEVLNAGPYSQIGNVWYVDAVNGSDTLSGNAWNNAFKTLYAAHLAATTNNYDVIVVAPAGTGTGTATDESTYGAWTFSKSLITVVGSSAPVGNSPRSRILWNTAGQSVNAAALLTISGSGNSFINVQFGTFVDNDTLVNVTGSRNFFQSVHFAGIGDATAGAEANARSLTLTGASENRFVDCTIGLDTVTRSAANASLELTGSCNRNRFEGCIFPMFTSSNGAFFIIATVGNCYQRFLILDSCIFLNAVDGSSTTITAGISNAGTGNGTIFMKDCWMHGATDQCTTYTNVYVTNPTVNTANQTFPVINAT